MNNWQNWAVAILLILCIIRVGLNIRNFIRQAKEQKSPCSSCLSNCELKRQYDHKRAECKGEKAATDNKNEATNDK